MSDEPPRRDPPRRGRARFLTPEEVDLWRKVTADVRPALGRSRRRAPSSEAVGEPAATKSAAADRPPAAATAPPKKPPPPPRQAPAPADLDHRTRTKLRRGTLEVEARLDLHGLRQAEAQDALVTFLRRAQASGARMAIVVTGKGARSEEGGVLRRLVPLWLQGAQMRDLVVSFGEAARHHGGEGALYVQIRRAGRGKPG
ncbi:MULTISPECIES: Smr/MutS family protein [Methylosinus]|uniref:DNA mismatch repair protein MutS n=1 Tax=Methylosinus trichosporium (strain ATCC 35070 / NCIMB 11131 / UNIQEM 75 / OB3b) TaxID=595536 RepID=A0A2D2D0Z6_METT3|nr:MULTISPECIES: Smr/MutS family protein [Methylosinus]ATQ68667.1 DNA mismatch repair protein MutS [Methylosinus trichosporium OB3b]OBS53169.1 DNA mismatch repair protein MutS [Methylosinus sp. 3S-1]